MKGQFIRKSVSILLALLMAVSLSPTAAFAVEDVTLNITREALSDTDIAVSEMLESLSAHYADTDDCWAAMAMAAYGKADMVAGKDIVDNARADYANNESIDRSIIALTALGVDASRVYGGNEGEYLDYIDKLAATPTALYSNGGIYSLVALDSGEYASSKRETYIEFLLGSFDNEVNRWTWGNPEWDVDLNAEAIAALAPYYGDANVKTAIDHALVFLCAQQNNSGHYGNANSTAMAIVALTALGIDPGANTGDFAKNGFSLIDGLLTFRTDSDRFGYDNGATASTMSTEQGFRALVAYRQFQYAGKTAYNIYRFGAQTGDGTALTGEKNPDNEPTEPGTSKNITVYFTLQGLNSGSGSDEIWIRNKAVTLTSGSTVADVIIKALEGSGYTQTGAKDGYVKSVTTPGGFTLSDETYDDSPYAGWLFKVNTDLPTVGINSYIVINGDQVLLYFTKDFTKDPDAGKLSGGNTSGSAILNADDTPLTGGAHLIENPFTDVENSAWYYGDIMWAFERGLMIGTAADKFSPGATLTRAMIAAILYRHAGTPDVSGLVNPFDDVAEGQWYTDAITWAADNGIVKGTGGGKFAPSDAITRQDLAVILMRYMNYLEINLPVTLQYIFFADEAAISGYAMDAIQTLNKLGIINGAGVNNNGQIVIDPKGNATRAHVAAMLQRFDACLSS